MWAAEGFLRSTESEHEEEVAEEYLEDLVKRSLVLVVKKRSNGRIKIVRIHDLLRDLCLRKARDEKFLHVINEFSPSLPKSIENLRCLCICSYISSGLPNIDGQHIHTILLFHHRDFLDSWKPFGLLRVVDALSVELKSYPEEIDELIHLRYLALTCIEIGAFQVPGSLSELQNLQTLIIRQRGVISASGLLKSTLYLPFRIWIMPQLRHLVLDKVGFLPDPSSTKGKKILPLENLHTLSRIIGFTCSKAILEMIPNILKLGIFYDDISGAGWSKHGLKNLVHMHKLEKLNFHVEPHDYSRTNLSKNLCFPSTLKKLTLSGCGLPWKDMTIVGSLPNLEVLKLKRFACHGFEWETNEGEFCRLNVLLIDETDLHHWITESSHFPNLERLVLYDCKNLRGISYDIGEMPKLELIEVDVGNLSIVESAKLIREEQESFGNDIQVRFLESRYWRW